MGLSDKTSIPKIKKVLALGMELESQRGLFTIALG